MMAAGMADSSFVKQRLISLDAFRGAVMALMVLVNTPGNGSTTYRPLEHAEWNGWTPTDVVFPSFLWIVGVAMTLSLGRRVEAGDPRGRLMMTVLRRGVILFLLGMSLYAYPQFNLGTQRILGVLQRIAICYVIAAAIYLWSGVRGQVLWTLGLLTGYWMLMTLVPVPGYGSGNLTVEGNLAHYVDSIVLGTHNYLSTKTWDPEGVVSTIPAVATALLGILAGQILRLRKPLSEKTTWLFLLGNLLIAAGLICDIWLPINKKLWTTSFSLFMAGLDCVIFAGFLWVIDGMGWKRLTRPFVILGMNAIVVYLASEFLEEIMDAIKWTTASGTTINLHHWIYQNVFAPIASPYNASLLFAICYVLLMYLIAYAMYRRGWFVRI
jgi:predicted acyltransferase